MFSKNETLKRISVCLAAVMLAVSAAGCSAGSADDAEKTDKEETTTTAAASSADEEESKTEGDASSEEEKEDKKDEEKADSSEAAAVTEAPTFDDLDSMIASMEADIPQITAFSGIDLGSKPELVTDSSSAAEHSAEPAVTTTTAAKPEANAPSTAELSNLQQFTFDGVKYDNASFTSAGVTKPNGWVQNNTNEKQYENSLYPECYILEGMHQGATFMISKKNGQTSFPSLQLYKGLTWGATVADAKAAYGAAVKEGRSEQYGTTMTNLFYTDAEGSLIIFMVSDDWGLFGINCQGK